MLLSTPVVRPDISAGGPFSRALTLVINGDEPLAETTEVKAAILTRPEKDSRNKAVKLVNEVAVSYQPPVAPATQGKWLVEFTPDDTKKLLSEPNNQASQLNPGVLKVFDKATGYGTCWIELEAGEPYHETFHCIATVDKELI